MKKYKKKTRVQKIIVQAHKTIKRENRKMEESNGEQRFKINKNIKSEEKRRKNLIKNI